MKLMVTFSIMNERSNLEINVKSLSGILFKDRRKWIWFLAVKSTIFLELLNCFTYIKVKTLHIKKEERKFMHFVLRWINLDFLNLISHHSFLVLQIYGGSQFFFLQCISRWIVFQTFRKLQWNFFRGFIPVGDKSCSKWKSQEIAIVSRGRFERIRKFLQLRFFF